MDENLFNTRREALLTRIRESLSRPSQSHSQYKSCQDVLSRLQELTFANQKAEGKALAYYVVDSYQGDAALGEEVLKFATL
ncbi:hypothetical protein H8B13_11930 [Hymenobacter sp. BT188]|uniref:hypothetical protein n=1 Tax=Hymenobacter sp. BT188 TaxID=2763504 RepID=UPI0016517EBA|nr:hypothetical protein [Hymenobacter sp. BT188]MBC6607529.1 hypothetical protein [Hymenobacter sp. BT188]